VRIALGKCRRWRRQRETARQRDRRDLTTHEEPPLGGLA
jgi:hypothetical protein